MRRLWRRCTRGLAPDTIGTVAFAGWAARMWLAGAAAVVLGVSGVSLFGLALVMVVDTAATMTTLGRLGRMPRPTTVEVISVERDA